VNHQTIQQQTRELGRYLTLFVYNKHLRTRIVDALNRTSDAAHDGNQRALRSVRKSNARLLGECQKAVEDMPSGIWNEVKIAIEERMT
jgi:hypothetical protein